MHNNNNTHPSGQLPQQHGQYGMLNLLNFMAVRDDASGHGDNQNSQDVQSFSKIITANIQTLAVLQARRPFRLPSPNQQWKLAIRTSTVVVVDVVVLA